jgi:uncharacterized membrane protein
METPMRTSSRDDLMVRVLMATNPKLVEAHQLATGTWLRRFRSYLVAATVVLVVGLAVMITAPFTKTVFVGVLVSLLYLAGVLTALAAYCLGHVHAYATPPAWRHLHQPVGEAGDQP